MKHHRFSNYSIQIFAALILFLFIISASVTLTLNFRPLYYADIKHLNISEMSGLDEAVIRENYDALIDYNSLFNHEPLSFPTLTMSESGRIHFEEVKIIFDLFGWLTLTTFPLLVIAVILSRRYGHFGWVGFGGLLSIVLPVLLGIMVAVNWNYVFVTFHKLVFNNDYWIFDAVTDPVITILPDTFFMHCAIMIFILIIMASIICIGLWRHLKNG